jgi:carbonic anhydrase
MASAMRASRAGVVVLSCSDPRLNPYQILGIDPTLSKHLLEFKNQG